MDFSLDEAQSAVAELAGKILGDRCTPEALRAHEASGQPFPPELWSELAQADLLGLCLPESVGGGGYGVLEACLVAEQVGRHVAPVPFCSTVGAAIVLARAGADAHAHLLRGVVDGDVVLAVVPGEPAAATRIAPVAARRDGEQWVLDGIADAPVQWAEQAAALLVAARHGDGAEGLFLVESGAVGLAVREVPTMWGLAEAAVSLSGTPATPVGDGELPAVLRRVLTALSCATVAGVCEGTIRLTAAYVSEREQFGAKIGTFQAVGQRMADAYIDTEAVHLTSRQAAWRLSSGLSCDDELAIAKFWAADGSHRVVHAGQHLHGGVGLDLETPVHRYYRWAKVLELRLGSATDHLRRLGESIASS